MRFVLICSIPLWTSCLITEFSFVVRKPWSVSRLCTKYSLANERLYVANLVRINTGKWCRLRYTNFLRYKEYNPLSIHDTKVEIQCNPKPPHCFLPLPLFTEDNRELKQNSRGRRRRRRQNNKTNYRRQKAHVNMWNKADIRAVLLSCETSTAPFSHSSVFKTWPTFQELTSIVSFSKRRWSQRNFSENRNMQGNLSKD